MVCVCQGEPPSALPQPRKRMSRPVRSSSHGTIDQSARALCWCWAWRSALPVRLRMSASFPQASAKRRSEILTASVRPLTKATAAPDAKGTTGKKTPTGKKSPIGRKPNIVFILTDNLGYGEPGCYGGGILRGAPTPRIDRLAAEGLRLLNFNVESQCTPSRSAIMTGRFAIRSGTMRVPPTDGKPYGLDAMGNHHRRAAGRARVTPPGTSANGTWATAKDVFPPTRVSTNGTESRTHHRRLAVPFRGRLRPENCAGRPHHGGTQRGKNPQPGSLRPESSPPPSTARSPGEPSTS